LLSDVPLSPFAPVGSARKRYPHVWVSTKEFFVDDQLLRSHFITEMIQRDDERHKCLNSRFR
jgi:hypothetical protein